MALIKCEECHHDMSDKAKQCPYCGYKNTPKKICEECKKLNMQNAKVCYNCGAPFKGNNIINYKTSISSNVCLLVDSVINIVKKHRKSFINCSVLLIIFFSFIFLFNTTKKVESNKSDSTYNNTSNSTNKGNSSNGSSSNSYSKPSNSEAKFMAQEICKGYLKSPSSAKWGSSVNVTSLGNDKYSVSGTVEAQNSYGAMIKSEYYAYFTFTGRGYKEGYCSITSR